MQKLFILAIASITVFGSVSLGAQELTAEEQQLVAEKYYDNPTYYHATQFLKAGMLDTARIKFQEAIHQFEQQPQWDAWIAANTSLIASYESTIENQTGIDIGIAAYKKIEPFATDYPIESERFLNRLGWLLYRGGDHRSIEYFSKIITLYEKAQLPLLSFEVGRAYKNIALCYDIQGKLELSEQMSLRAIEIGETAENCDLCLTLLAAANTNLGNMFRRKGNLEKAVSYIEKGVNSAMAAMEEYSLHLVPQYYSMAAIQSDLGESQNSRKYYRKILFVIEKSGTKNEYYTKNVVTECLAHIGSHSLALNDTSSAKQSFQEVISISKGYPRVSRAIITAHAGLGQMHWGGNSFEQALHYYERTDSLLSTLPEGTYGLPTLKMELEMLFAKLYRSKGEFEKAIYHSKNAAKLYPYVDYSRGDNTSTELYCDIAQIFHMNEQLDSALQYYQYALLQGAKKFNQQEDLMKLPLASDLWNNHANYIALEAKASVLQDLASTEQNKAYQQKLYAAALATISLADSFHINNLRKINLLRGTQSQYLINQSIPSFSRGLSLSFDAFQMYPLGVHIEQGFYFTQKMKAQHLWLSLLNSEATVFSNIPKDFLDAENNLLSDITYYEKSLLEAKNNKDTLTAIELENKYLFNAQVAYRELVQQMESEYPEYYTSKFSFTPETTLSLQQLLQKDELLIEYAFADSALFIFTLSTSQGLQLQKIPVSEKLDNTIESMDRILRNGPMLRKSSQEQFISLNHAIYQQLLLPIENQLKGKRRLIIIGDGVINYIPFEMLLSSPSVKPFEALHFLLRDHEISYHYSSKLFAKARRKTQNLNRHFFAFAPVYEQMTNTIAVNLPLNTNLRAINGDGNFTPLPESEKEVKAIATLFEQQSINHTTLTLRQEATEAALKTNLEQPYQFIHIAGHSFADLENPKFSGIACFQIDSTGQNINTLKEDGILCTGEIYNINTNTDLVTLSSCESGYGKLKKTEGLLGLNRAFIYAGTPNVVFSLWKVYDKVSAELMIDFYKNILQGRDYAQSLRQAKLNLLNEEKTASPHYWAPYLLIGR